MRIHRRWHFGHPARSVGEKRLQEGNGPWRRRHQLPWGLTKTQAELQHVPGFLRIFPFSKFIGPSHVKLRAAQAFWVFRGKHLRHGPVWPNEPAARYLEGGAATAGDTADAGNAVDHHLTGIPQGFRNKRDAQIRLLAGGRNPVHPFGPGAGLAGSAPADQKPRPPVTLRRLLRQVADETPVAQKGEDLLLQLGFARNIRHVSASVDGLRARSASSLARHFCSASSSMRLRKCATAIS
ncbi:hypothetical protein D3C87_1237920 [compost metagenome]